MSLRLEELGLVPLLWIGFKLLLPTDAEDVFGGQETGATTDRGCQGLLPGQQNIKHS